MPANFFYTTKTVQKQLKKLPIQINKRSIEAFDKLKADPLAGEKLHGELAGYYKYRLGDYRIVYSFDVKTRVLNVVKIEHRQGIYK